ncbi:hypothetical protein ASG43_04420 [Aureimonas sp. Leaf454]|uniref:CPBP family intramembrane glutamic endopeptidase n=1 Tax=Aureimonas sp. Leaf454 TaxID=1736381 RepID=UPI0006F9E55C|nr:type II CAAX endopeptidase family protein [Aureimonas sp. Leaf454]KQT54806.1 hypothetical protein ASG43_04420 [Aureimonas sp. Leaf454]
MMTSRHERPRAADASRATDLPFCDGVPVRLAGRDWIVVLAATLAAFGILSLSPAGMLSGALSILPAILFTGLPLAALAFVSGGHAGALFKPYGLRAFGQSVLFAFATITASLAVASVVQTFAPLQPNAVADVLATIGTFDLVVFLVRTFIQLIGEELTTVLPLLAVVWMCRARFGFGHRASLVAGVAVSTTWFAALHLPTYGWNVLQCFAVIGTARLVLTWAYLRTRNLWVCAGAHIINDGSIFAIGYAGSHLPVGV